MTTNPELKHLMKRFQIAERVKHVRDRKEGAIVELHYPGWVDWRPDDYKGPIDGAIRTDPSNLQRVQP